MSPPRSNPEQVPPRSHPIPTRSAFDLEGYIEQGRLALESLRISFECERAAFAEERKLWEKERCIMQQRIAELEGPGGKAGNAAATGPKVNLFKGPQAEEQHHVWEGSSPTARPSRVFPGDVPQAEPESEGPGLSPSLDDALSPRSRPIDRSGHVPVPIELVDSSLDGITLKSTALPPDIAARVSPPILTSFGSRDTAPFHKPVDTELNPGLPSQEPPCLASPVGGIPSDTYRTPMVPLDQAVETMFPFPIAESMPNESPHAPFPSLFPVASLDTAHYHKELGDDPALQGTLGLQNDIEQDLEFLEELDEKLLKEAQRALSRPSLSSDEEDGQDDGEPPEPEPEIRFKRSTNFGSAFGSTQLGS
uniref:Uncharacterized protein n=1 Tax=Coccidioides posadasii RMSCC 3488 TaxID=454284 RepID=A0A0J6F9T4_COCPO|nr:hypothetical protein CPAG_03304 [Coccidioides posadasii RMSCC 3488]